ncbi:MAG: GerMN domain-containing protein [candidate division NC10 bacterium]|nr:GerMN domain-containing protein [candidate division NC10 bacterium]
MDRSRWFLLAAVASATLVAGIGFLLGQTRSTFVPPARPPSLEQQGRAVHLFFVSEGGTLVEEERLIPPRPTAAEEAKEVLTELIRGPRVDHFPTIPKGTNLLALFIDVEGTAYVDFDLTFQTNHPGGSLGEFLTIYSIVDTLGYNFPEIKQVQILMEGEETPTLTGHLDLRRPLKPRVRLQLSVT